jgi:nucleotide-binding universal stress UspA family protein
MKERPPLLGSRFDPGPASHLRLQLALVAVAALTLLAPARLGAWGIVDGQLHPVGLLAPGRPPVPPVVADLDGDGRPEALDRTSGALAITSGGSVRWKSPEDWSITQAEFTDLNRDGTPEVTLLVWREFRPLPTDRLLPHVGRIDDFHNTDGQSCQLILIGADGRGGFREVWAGSALAEPVTAFAAADLDRDGRQELITLENRYTDDPFQSPARSLKVWEWNGFGFTVIGAGERSLSRLVVVQGKDASQIVAELIR